ncbi:hypothetical protein [Mesorhizobium caraganae]|uniref:hypothetical protein n=1 Tax=Mesorhizobium caraganae TaxID=483206 RepID=UPI001FE412D2|nr:hypothetical protein [Mesorhizobium caraganae]
MAEPEHGHVILYSYLWAREFDRREESGRKARPTCMMVIVAGKDGCTRPLLFPITSKAPGPDRRCVEIPETEAKRAKLYTPAWVIVDVNGAAVAATDVTIDAYQLNVSVECHRAFEGSQAERPGDDYLPRLNQCLAQVPSLSSLISK